MRSCQDYLSELRAKIHEVEDRLRSETKTLYKVHEVLNEEKDKWAAEFKEEELKIHVNEMELKEKETILEKLKADYDEVRRRSSGLDVENEKLKRDLQRAKMLLQDKMNKFLLEQGNLEKELSKVQDLLKDTKISNKWTKIFQDRELKAQESEKESQLREKMKQLSDEFTKKVADYDENLKEIDLAGLVPKREKLRSLQETLVQMNNECKDIDQKNKDLERQIRTLKKL